MTQPPEPLRRAGHAGVRVPGCPAVHKAICVSLAVEFGDSGEQWIELESVGAGFCFREE